ncbi:hypothetical protein LTR36_010576 [Oleoguttula mirabilis]|uniref:Phosphatidate phosphatase APP1 catalytic domain-containing protein n=1 Tax=Oleoguttula mirabilis TaxID=1507867 RepID=A0AAV9JR44_9PEZI|nr:hypothetical protein LTR36_010576 [Oleoguttula mirabilis]
MAYTGSSSGPLAYGDYSGLRSEARESGYKRKKIAGLLKAANEVRQSYFTGDGSTVREGGDEFGTEGLGAFPDAAVVRSGNEEMILFPSYARRHVKSKADVMPGKDASEREYWAKEWEKHQNDNAVVDVDVRGWIYTPHRGQNTRKQRLAIGLARQLAGIQAPPATKSNDSLQSSQASSRAPSPTRLTRQEEDLINLEAETIVRRGQAEERKAQRGAYSETPSKDTDGDSVYGPDSRNPSPDRLSRLSRVTTMSSMDDELPITPLQKRSSWAQPSKMTATELTVANAHLIARLKPFMHNPLANTAISAFFYNDKSSRQHTVYTNDSGHFSFHASLDFVPTHVRVLAGEKLSATEEVAVTSPKGVSVISDIDDTVKHSAISAGFQEIFRNAFIRDLNDLTIEGVREWYNTLYDMGVKVHYVSNSPWQMYPILTSYFKMAQLPKGSFHLKQYTGMLNGIFEPVAERKKSSLDKILRDFPDRKFMLVGDSGEADLEVYTDVALANPNRVLGIFIRDVTTPVKTGYFDSSMGPSGSAGHSRNHSRHRSGDSLATSKRISRPDDIRHDEAELQAAIAASLGDMEEEARLARQSINPDAPGLARFDGTSGGRGSKPELPLRRRAQRMDSEARMTASPEEEEDLIDFSEERAPSKPWLAPPLSGRGQSPMSGHANGLAEQSRPTPSPPPKPRALRSPSPNPQATPTPDSAAKPLRPPRPRKPSSAVKPTFPLPSSQQTMTMDGAQTQATPTPPSSLPQPQPLPQLQTHQPSPLSQVSRQDSPLPSDHHRPPLPARPRMHQKLATAASTYWHGSGSNPTVGGQQQPRPLSSYGGSNNNAETPRSMSSSLSSSKSMDDLRTTDTPLSTRSKPAPPPPPPRRNVSAYPFASTARKATNRLSGAGSGAGGGGGSGWDAADSPPGTPGAPGGEAGMTTKERLWRQRWARAQGLLEPRGVTLRSWRVGADVAHVAVKLAEMELRRIEREEAV